MVPFERAMASSYKPSLVTFPLSLRASQILLFLCSSKPFFPPHLCGELQAERFRTDDLMPSIPVVCLPPSRVDPKVLGLNVVIYHSQPGGFWTTRRSPPIRWWSQRGGDDTVVVLFWSSSSQVPEKNLNRNDLTFSETGKQPAMLLTVSFVVCLVYGIRKIFRRHQVSKASRRFARVLLMVQWSMSRTHRAGLGGCRSYRGAP